MVIYTPRTWYSWTKDHISYRGYVFKQLPSHGQSYHGVCTWVIKSTVRTKLSGEGGLCFQTTFSPPTTPGPMLPWYLRASYYIYGAYSTTLFKRKLSVMFLNSSSPGQNYHGVCASIIRVVVCKKSCYLRKRCRGMSSTFYPGSKLSPCLCMSYQVYGV